MTNRKQPLKPQFWESPDKNLILILYKKLTMWGANKWTDSMFKKYWWVALLLVLAFFVTRTAL